VLSVQRDDPDKKTATVTLTWTAIPPPAGLPQFCDGEDEDATARLDGAIPDDDDRADALDALRAFESAPAEEEPEEDESDFLTSDEDGEGSEETDEPGETDGSEEAGAAGTEDATEETASEPGNAGPETENPEK
jgi:hypothetical protein